VPAPALEAIATLVTLGPGLPLVFMGEEYGEERPFLYFTSHGDPELGRAVSEGRKREFIAEAGGEVPDPQSPGTFHRSRLTHRRDGAHGALWRHHREMLAIRRRHAAAIAAAWPRVTADGRCVTMHRRGLEVTVNLGDTAAAGLPPWGWAVSEG
jgi:maltooligosyltrehalose trehalohydrolase